MQLRLCKLSSVCQLQANKAKWNSTGDEGILEINGENLFIDSTSFGSRRPFNPKPLPFLSKRFLWEIGYNETSVRRFTTGNSSIFCGKSKIVNQNKLESKIKFNLVSKKLKFLLGLLQIGQGKILYKNFL